PRNPSGATAFGSIKPSGGICKKKRRVAIEAITCNTLARASLRDSFSSRCMTKVARPNAACTGSDNTLSGSNVSASLSSAGRATYRYISLFLPDLYIDTRMFQTTFLAKHTQGYIQKKTQTLATSPASVVILY